MSTQAILPQKSKRGRPRKKLFKGNPVTGLLEKEAKDKLDELRKQAKKDYDAARHLNRVTSGKAKSTIILENEIEAIPDFVKAEISNNVVFRPHPGPQTEFLAATEKEVFYGGARGGGKSYSLIVDPLRYANKEAHRALILRRTMPELRDLINHSQRLYDKAFPGAKWREQEKEWRFPSGARIEFGYAENTQDALRYQGQAYTWIGVDELPQFPTSEVWNLLKGSLRSVDPTVPTFMRATGNPGNIGSMWVKEMFIDAAEPNTTFYVHIDPDDPTSDTISRRFIPAKLDDNPSLTQTKEYRNMLLSLPEIKRKQWLAGDWSAFEGSAFPEFSMETHVVLPFPIPENWVRFRSCDWGYSTPFCVLWFAVDYNNNIYIYREFYSKGLTADIFAQQVRMREAGESIQFGVMDSSVWARRGDVGPSIVEIMRTNGCYWRPSDRSPNSRLAGKYEIHRRLALRDTETGEKKPALFIFNNCRNLIRTLPLLPMDELHPEDVNTKAEDHAYDALRYGCMSRPLTPDKIDFYRQQLAHEEWTPAHPKVGY